MALRRQYLAIGAFVKLNTPRLILRYLSPADADDVFEWTSNPDVPRYMSWSPHKTLDDAMSFIKSARALLDAPLGN